MIQEKSVTITRHERELLKEAVHENFMKVAESRHPNKNFINSLAIDITERAYDKLYEYMDTPVALHLAYESYKYRVADALRRFKLPNELFIYELIDNSSNDLLLAKRSYIEFFDEETIIIPDKFKINENYVNPFSTPEHNKLLDIDEETISRIEKHNAKMEENLLDIQECREFMLKAVKNSKTTKMLYSKTKDLNSFFPKSLQNKIQDKNEDLEKNLSEEQQILNKAANYMAAATLLGG